MPKLIIFDPPMCCSTGVCGPQVDPRLVAFAADCEWLRTQGVSVERHDPARDYAAFVATPAVTQAITARGTTCLPILVVDGTVVHEGSYPDRAKLLTLLGMSGGEVSA